MGMIQVDNPVQLFCPERRRAGLLPCGPVNHEVVRRDGEILTDRWFCSCGKRMPAPVGGL